MSIAKKQWSLLLTTVLALVISLAATTLAGALDDYVAAPDSSYAWSAIQRTTLPGGATLHQLSLTSQTWHGITWRHRLSVVMPAGTPKRHTALLYITGSGSGTSELTFMTALANQLSTPVAAIFDIPNQPLFGNLNEDALISYTFMKCFETGDQTWPLLLPMTKGAVRAMDALTAFAGTLGIKIDGFVVFGGSKRGWTTWLTAVVDKRVKGIAPIAYDNLELAEQMEHQLVRFGGYSQQIDDYTDRNLQSLLPTERGKQLVSIVDPYAYKDRLALPKLLIRGTNDPYWPVDAVQLYLKDLPGNTWLRYDPNAGHGLTNLEQVLATVSGFYLHVVGELPLQPLRFSLKEDAGHATLEVQGHAPAATINLWQAFDTTTDFRKAAWTVQMAGPGQSHSFDVPKPASGYKALYAEVVYKIGNTSLILDTPVYVIGPAK